MPQSHIYATSPPWPRPASCSSRATPLWFVLLARGAPPAEAGLDLLSAGGARLATALVGQCSAVVLLLGPQYRDAAATAAAAMATATAAPPAPLLLAYHAASSVWHCAFLFAWVQPALGRALPTALRHAAVLLTALLATVAEGGGGGADGASLAERSLTGWPMALGVAVGLSGLVVAAAPVAWAVGATTVSLRAVAEGEVLTPAWSDVASEGAAAALSIVALLAWCG